METHSIDDNTFPRWVNLWGYIRELTIENKQARASNYDLKSNKGRGQNIGVKL